MPYNYLKCFEVITNATMLSKPISLDTAFRTIPIIANLKSPIAVNVATLILPNQTESVIQDRRIGESCFYGYRIRKEILTMCQSL